MNLLWFSNISISEELRSSGTWIYSMFHNLIKNDGISYITNITLGNSSHILNKTGNKYSEYIIPKKWLVNKKKPSKAFVKFLNRFIENNKIDIIHIWGMEMPWAVGVLKIKTNTPILLEIQGFKGVCSSYFNGNFDKLPKNILGRLEFLYPKISNQYTKKRFLEYEKTEQKILSLIKYFNTQSDWVRNILNYKYKVKTKIFKTDIILRDSFTKCEVWNNPFIGGNNPVLFTTSSPIPYKGVHVIIEALAMLKEKYPNIKLNIAGINNTKFKHITNGYIRYIDKLIKKLSLENNVVFYGNLSEYELVNCLHKCNVFINASFIETYCLALAEALVIGVPSVASYSSALPELMGKESGEMFPPGDSIFLASKIDELLSNPEKCSSISKKASEIMRERINIDKIVEQQLSTYHNIINESHS